MKRQFSNCISAFALILISLQASRVAPHDRPNIVWLVLDDASPDLGCYGDTFARTPHMDRLASDGFRFTNAFTHAPVCAPSRSGLVTGMYPTTIGTHHMRSKLISPPPIFTTYLRKVGYYVAWPGKTDFNFDVPPDAFDSTADWTERAPRQPFFAYLNLGMTHESQIRLEPGRFAKVTARIKPEERHDPAKVVVPPYYPDSPEVRVDLAHYYDLMTAADYKIGDVLASLDRQGLAGNTVVFLFADHGRGMPRAKRWIYDSGIHVPLIIRWPGKLKPGSKDDRLVSFIDFAPTVLSLAGIEIPARVQGQPFLGGRVKEREYVFAARDRMDETFDRIRAVRDKRYKYIRNFFPQLPYAQRIAYNEENPTMQVWRRLNTEGKLSGPAKLFFAPTKPKEELYDTQSDPFEIKNLASDPRYEKILKRMRQVLDRWIVQTKDMGDIPEQEMIRRGLVKDVLTGYEARKAPQ